MMRPIGYIYFNAFKNVTNCNTVYCSIHILRYKLGKKMVTLKYIFFSLIIQLPQWITSKLNRPPLTPSCLCQWDRRQVYGHSVIQYKVRDLRNVNTSMISNTSIILSWTKVDLGNKALVGLHCLKSVLHCKTVNCALHGVDLCTLRDHSTSSTSLK